jgi:hypothetical protein
MSNGNPIGKIKHPGALHRMLDKKLDQKLTEKDLQGAMHSSNPLERKRANFAINARKWNHSK